MRHINHKLKAALVGLESLALVGLGGCQSNFGSTTPAVTSTQIPTLGPVTLRPIGKWDPNLVLFDDVPGNWQVGGRTTDQELGADSLYYWYINSTLPRESRAGPSENFAVYPTVEVARDRFSDWHDKVIPPDRASHWKKISDNEFLHHADEMAIACLPASVNAQPFLACAAIARYQNMIVVIQGNVYEDKWFTFDDYRAVLAAADRRIALVLSGNSP